MRITFEAAELPEDHPEKYNHRSGTISKRWWNVTLVTDDGKTIQGTAHWNHTGEIQDAIYHLTRPERPSETVMRRLAEQERAK